MLKEASQHTVFLHCLKEFDNNLGAWSDQNLTLSSFLSIIDAFQGIVEDGSLDHDSDRGRERTRLSQMARFSSREEQGLEVSMSE